MQYPIWMVFRLNIWIKEWIVPTKTSWKKNEKKKKALSLTNNSVKSWLKWNSNIQKTAVLTELFAQ